MGFRCTCPAEMTWKAGVDVLTFGGTKNGCMGVEAVVFFDPAKAWEFELRRKRGGHLYSKHRYLSAQSLRQARCWAQDCRGRDPPWRCGEYDLSGHDPRNTSAAARGWDALLREYRCWPSRRDDPVSPCHKLVDHRRRNRHFPVTSGRITPPRSPLGGLSAPCGLHPPKAAASHSAYDPRSPSRPQA